MSQADRSVSQVSIIQTDGRAVALTDEEWDSRLRPLVYDANLRGPVALECEGKRASLIPMVMQIDTVAEHIEEIIRRVRHTRQSVTLHDGDEPVVTITPAETKVTS